MACVSFCALVRRLWRDEAGFVISAELVLIATILVIGMIVGLSTIRDQVVQELGDVAAAFSNLDQSFSISAITSMSASTNGSVFADAVDFGDSISTADSFMTINLTPAQGDTP